MPLLFILGAVVLRCALSRQIQKGQNTISVIRLCSVKKNNNKKSSKI